MAEPFIGEIRMFGGNFAPLHWTFCYGQLLAIADQQALYSLIGTAFGGDGRSSFGIPDFRGRIPIHQGAGPGLTPRIRGQVFGQETVALTVDQIPAHQHAIQASTSAPEYDYPVGMVLGTPNDGSLLYTNPTALPSPNLSELADEAVSDAGSGGAHYNMMPTTCISFIIALKGIFPSRN